MALCAAAPALYFLVANLGDKNQDFNTIKAWRVLVFSAVGAGLLGAVVGFPTYTVLIDYPKLWPLTVIVAFIAGLSKDKTIDVLTGVVVVTVTNILRAMRAFLPTNGDKGPPPTRPRVFSDDEYEPPEDPPRKKQA